MEAFLTRDIKKGRRKLKYLNALNWILGELLTTEIRELLRRSLITFRQLLLEL
jgi:hypothetical protein